MSYIVLSGISKTYCSSVKQEVLKGVDLRVEKGQMVAITGVSGSGKSTLLSILGLIDRDYSGDYYCDGINISKLSDSDISIFRNKKIGYIYQDFNLINSLNVIDNVRLSLKIGNIIKRKSDRMVKSEITDKSMNILETMGLKDHVKKYPCQLSGGQKQRVAIARTLVKNPDIILADEPTGSLDRKMGEDIMNCIEEISSNKTTIIVTHNEAIAKRCNRQLRLLDGKLIEE